MNCKWVYRNDMKEKLKITFRALEHRNFRLFFYGQGISVIGTWMQRVAMSWLVYRLTDSAFLLGIVGFSTHIPIFLLSPIAGVLVDRFSRRRILILTQTLAMLQALLLSYLYFSGKIQVWHIITFGIVLGISSAFDIPGRQAFYSRLVDKKENIQNAIALNAMLYHMARFVGPSLAGLVIAGFGEGICFLLNAISYLAMIFSLLLMKFDTSRQKDEAKEIIEEFLDGFRYVFQNIPIRKILILIGLTSLFGSPYIVILPIFAKNILGGGPVTLGLLTSFASLGALFASFYIASRQNIDRSGKGMLIFGFIFSFSLILFAFSKYLPLSLAIISITGLGLMGNMVLANSLIQDITSEEKRGRVMSFYTVSHAGMVPFGELLLASIAGFWGGGPALAIGGLLTGLSLIIFTPGILKSLRVKV